MGSRKKKASKSAGKSKSAKKASKSALECTINVVSAEGSSHGTVKFELTPGCTVGDALKKQGVSSSRKNCQIDGKPVGLDAVLTAGCTLTVEERAQGS